MNMLDLVSGLGIVCGIILIFLSASLFSSAIKGSQRWAATAILFLGGLLTYGCGAYFILGELS